MFCPRGLAPMVISLNFVYKRKVAVVWMSGLDFSPGIMSLLSIILWKTYCFKTLFEHSQVGMATVVSLHFVDYGNDWFGFFNQGYSNIAFLYQYVTAWLLILQWSTPHQQRAGLQCCLLNDNKSNGAVHRSLLMYIWYILNCSSKNALETHENRTLIR